MRPRLVLSLFAFACSIAGTTMAQTTSPPCEDGYGNFVGTVIVRDGKVVVMATRAMPSWRGRQWRFRALPSYGDKKIVRFDVARVAVQGVVVYEGGATTSIDLTREIKDLSSTTSSFLAVSTSEAKPSPCTIGLNGDKGKAGLEKLEEELKAFLTGEGFLDAEHQAAIPEIQDWYSVSVAPLLYAPVLQFAPQERVLPSSFDIWNELAPVNKRPPTDAELEALYRQYRRRSRTCTVYYQHQQGFETAGSWVVQFWLYYPFDIGGVGQHMHDSEHLFVEVDKLGGAVRRVVGAGHGEWAPNNIFNTFGRRSLPVTLPLHAIVELGKHATAPDIDADGFFTPGIDSNNDWDAAKVWGIRDTTGVTDSNLRAFNSSMMVRRTKEGRRVPEHFPQAGAASGDSPDGCVFLPLSEASMPPQGVKRCDGNHPDCARTQITHHTDYKDINAILKPAIYPPVSVRGGFSWLATADDDSTFSEHSKRIVGGVAIEWSKMRFPVPGRLAVDVFMEPTDFGFDGVSVRHEMMASNLFGVYGGISYINDDLKDFIPLIREANRKRWVSAGGLFEFPLGFLQAIGLNRRVTLNAQGGLNYNNYYLLNWEARFGVGVTFRRPNSKFGITSATPNPY